MAQPSVRWCLVAYEVGDHFVVKPKPEDCAQIAIDNGWIVLGRDSEIPYTPPTEDIEPSQRNCNRAGDTGE
jgi:hypothetical protein